MQVLKDEQLDTIATSDVVVFSLFGNESASKEAISHLANLVNSAPYRDGEYMTAFSTFPMKLSLFSHSL